MTNEGSDAHESAAAPPVQRGNDRSVVRFNVNLQPDAAEVLREYADRKGISLTEAVRRAIGVLQFVDEAQKKGSSVLLNDNGNLKEVMFLV